MDFDLLLNSESVRDQSAAAVFMRALGSDGTPYLPKLLEKCMAIDPTQLLDRYEETLIGLGAISMSEIINAERSDSSDELRIAILKWVAKIAMSPNALVSAHAIYGLGCFRNLPIDAGKYLKQIIESEPRPDELQPVTRRAIALRMLRRLDAAEATAYVTHPALTEYANSLAYWLKSPGTDLSDSKSRLQEELEWLIAIRGEPEEC